MPLTDEDLDGIADRARDVGTPLQGMSARDDMLVLLAEVRRLRDRVDELNAESWRHYWEAAQLGDRLSADQGADA